MRIFLDTSSLFKLYHREAGTDELESLFSIFKITNIFLSEISKVEFVSTIWKKVRTQEITQTQAITTIKLFEEDFEKYTFIATNTIIIEQARILVSKYGKQGLRTLDGIQLATCTALSQQVEVFFSADKLLKTLLEAEELNTEIANL